MIALKPTLRRTAWIVNQAFWGYVFPAASSAVSKAAVRAINTHILPKTTSPFTSGHLLRKQTVDGALLVGSSSKAWAKYAIPKGLPLDDKRVLAIENDPHFVDDFDGEILEGYGKGKKTLLLSEQVVVKVGGVASVQKLNYHVHDADRAGRHFDIVVTGVKPGTNQWELNIPRGELKGRYAFVTTPRGMIVTRMKDNGIQMAKPVYTLRSEEVLTGLNPKDMIVERKIDGSLGNAVIKDQRVMFRSHRDSAETYYDKLPAIEFIRNNSYFLASRYAYPGPSLTGTIFQGELAHPDGAPRVSGILNSLAPNARAIQKQRGPVSFYVWDVLKYRGRDVSQRTYEERRALLEQLVREIRTVNKYWHTVEKMGLGESPLSFYNRVITDPLPFGEGVVVKPIDSIAQKWDKLKVTGFGYFKLVDILPGEGKYAKSVGRFIVENPANGARGEVGSFSIQDDTRSWIWRNRKYLIGDTVKVRAQETTARGVPRAGVFYGFHGGHVDLLMAAEANAAGTGKTTKQVMYAMKSASGWKRNA